jgi:hypothetical protein
MKIQEPIPHWNNFTVPELKEILEHCRALERLGIAQDEGMLVSIERDITLREKKLRARPYASFELKPIRTIHHTVKQIHSKTNKQERQSEDYLLAQNV